MGRIRPVPTEGADIFICLSIPALDHCQLKPQPVQSKDDQQHLVIAECGNLLANLVEIASGPNSFFFDLLERFLRLGNIILNIYQEGSHVRDTSFDV